MLEANIVFLMQVFGFGVFISSALGPIALTLVNASVRIGRRVGLICAFGAACADLTCAVISFFLYGYIVKIVRDHHEVIRCTSHVLLIAVGLYIALASLFGKKGKSDESAYLKIVGRNPFISLYILTMVNPMTIPAFIAFIGAIKVEGQLSMIDKVGGSILLFLASTIVQTLIVIFAGALSKNLLKGNMLKYINIVSGIGIAAFGSYGLFF